MAALGRLLPLYVRRDLAADDVEVQVLLGLAEDCPDTTVVYEAAP
ncbi:hypothetical protein [Streptomyces sp. G1]|nr:hypothetical protein [Streptomyces sp. G1]